MNLNELYSLQYRGLLEALREFEPSLPAVKACGDAFVSCLRGGNCIFTCGNGGSAAQAMHMAEELVGRFRLSRKAMKAVALCADPTALTCIANDFGFDAVFSRQVEALGSAGDVLVLFSTSGRSPNLLRAAEAAQARGMKTIALLGGEGDGGPLAALVGLRVVVPGTDSARVQEVHTHVLHSWIQHIETEMPVWPDLGASNAPSGAGH
jgi:D-sedoheptulose 7-phosphate isomerase